uniref:Myb/SANT-like DNA-binding domain-containing protein n=1 Tax=Magallana gigas TaxID=29159 RepID=K1QTH6_MAGGI
MASECSESVSDASLKIKKPNWTELEKNILVEEVHLREGLLFGKFKGAGGGKIAKDVAWREVAQAVNGSSGSGILRTSGEVVKQYSNLKQRAKGKLSESKRPKTGGGPKPPSPTPVELSILEQLEGRPSLEGICGGIDTADPVETQPSTSSSASSDVPAKKKDVQDLRKSQRWWPRSQVLIGDNTIYTYGDSLQKHISQCDPKAHALRNVASTTIWPRDYLEVDVPKSILDRDGLVAVEPHLSESFGVPSILHSVVNKICIENTGCNPLSLRKHELFCQVRPV